MTEGRGSNRHYVLGLFFIVYLINFVDRQILSILIEPIKLELGASDTVMGLLTGLASRAQGDPSSAGRNPRCRRVR